MARDKSAITSLAEKLGTSRMTVWRWLAGERNASKGLARAIVEVLGGDPGDLGQLEIWRSDGPRNSTIRTNQVERWFAGQPYIRPESFDFKPRHLEDDYVQSHIG